ncbi:MAG: thymidylate synthase [Candidatus Aenigmatarchaeota archaeon]
MKKDIEIINENSNVAISTLWTKKELILNKISEKTKSKIGIIGTTYTAYGINYILETLSKYPKIDTLIVFGADLSTSGLVLEEAFKLKKIPKIVSLDHSKVKKILETIDLIDLREEFKKRNFEVLENTINEKYKENAKNVREILDLTVEEKAELKSWPIPLSGHYIYETSIFRAWVKILDLIMKFGSIKASEYEEPQKEYLNLMVTIGLYGKDYKIEEEFFEYINEKEFEKHINEVLNPRKPEGVDYTYGERIFSHRFGKNQIEYLINKLSKAPYSRRALVVSWDHEIDQNVSNPPCIIGIQGIITDNYYNHTVWIRSNDMVKGWPVNIVGQIELAKFIVNEINKRTNANFEIGAITTISTSAHIYKHDWDLVREILAKHSIKMKEFIEDPKGNFLIYIKDDKIVLEHRTPDNSAIIFRIESKDFWEIYNALKGGNIVSLYDHALYLGKELRSAFEKFKRGEKYIQDEA